MPRRASSKLGQDHVPTPSQTVGPFFGYALPFDADADAASGAGALRIEGRLLDRDGEPVPDGMIEVWSGPQFARCSTDGEGAFHLAVTQPGATRGDADPQLSVTVL